MVPNRKTLVIILSIILIVWAIGISYLIAGIWRASNKNTPHQPLTFPTRSSGTALPTENQALINPSSLPGLPGKITFVCQIFKLQAQDQICLIYPDGSGWRRITDDDDHRHYYPSLAPDGNSVEFSSNLDGNFKLYEQDLGGILTPLGNTIGFAPEVSPDGKTIVFANTNGQDEMIWLMDRDGGNKRLLYRPAWDPTWSPDGKQILFATNFGDKVQLVSINIDGTDFKKLTDLPDIRGRSDWSPDGTHIVTYSGKPWEREIYIMNSDGSDAHQISPPGGNSQGPSFSPDGLWVAFTAYYGSKGNNNGCEIYIMKIDGSNLRRLTTNDYCDWQPRWGP
jgi:Tol biopolymer transport system component